MRDSPGRDKLDPTVHDRRRCKRNIAPMFCCLIVTKPCPLPRGESKWQYNSRGVQLFGCPQFLDYIFPRDQTLTLADDLSIWSTSSDQLKAAIIIQKALNYSNNGNLHGVTQLNLQNVTVSTFSLYFNKVYAVSDKKHNLKKFKFLFHATLNF